VLGTPFFMKYLLHPLTLINVTIVGTLGIIQALHTHAHYNMTLDADSYVTQFLKKNPDFLKSKCWDVE
jgi:hypothetical protein